MCGVNTNSTIILAERGRIFKGRLITAPQIEAELGSKGHDIRKTPINIDINEELLIFENINTNKTAIVGYLDDNYYALITKGNSKDAAFKKLIKKKASGLYYKGNLLVHRARIKEFVDANKKRTILAVWSTHKVFGAEDPVCNWELRNEAEITWTTTLLNNLCKKSKNGCWRLNIQMLILIHRLCFNETFLHELMDNLSPETPIKILKSIIKTGQPLIGQ
jgi:hypothetical protein